MAYRNGDRNQLALMPACIDDYISADDPVRAYDAFVEALDLKELGIIWDPNKVGNSNYNPKAMIKLQVYGTAYGPKSSRKLERATHHNLSFIWLMGGLTPDHKTIAEFRRNNKDALKKIIKQCAQLCIELDLIDGNILFMDGTKVRANAGRCKNYSPEKYKELSTKLDERINQLFEECEQIDTAEAQQESLVKMKKELTKTEHLNKKVKEVLARFQEQEKNNGKAPKTINLTDPDSALMKSCQGSHASYNLQNVVDDKHGLIVHTQAVGDTSDVNQFAQQLTQAEEVLKKQCEIGCADAGYADTTELAKIDKRGTTKVIVPSQRQALHEEAKPFNKSVFKYNKEENCYYCPEGQKLIYEGQAEPGKIGYRIVDSNICKQCKNYGLCTSAKKGRKIVRLTNEEIKEKLERQYEEPASLEVYARRKCRAEHPFGHIKQNLGIKNFLMRGKDGVQAEASIAATCFNIARMITIFGGITQFIAKLANVQPCYQL